MLESFTPAMLHLLIILRGYEMKGGLERTFKYCHNLMHIINVIYFHPHIVNLTIILFVCLYPLWFRRAQC